ncbi:hypothetical protein GWK47_026938 [Chionoecetes opilio]|uniref:Uncharacterized protein n=1 Tax=Chionoecetes opilio TaxID=41210 RepID=A0A8J8W9X2_CHIOP|nr:hypothetical protein GWK47_026938 [Chionoecetes opilio]
MSGAHCGGDVPRRGVVGGEIEVNDASNTSQPRLHKMHTTFAPLFTTHQHHLEVTPKGMILRCRGGRWQSFRCNKALAEPTFRQRLEYLIADRLSPGLPRTMPPSLYTQRLQSQLCFSGCGKHLSTAIEDRVSLQNLV